MSMVTAKMAVTVAIVIQRQAFATNRALVAVEAKGTTGIEASPFEQNIRVAVAFRAVL